MASTHEVLERKFSVPESGRILHVSRETVRRMIKRGELRGYRVGHKFVIPMSSLRECLGDGLYIPNDGDL